MSGAEAHSCPASPRAPARLAGRLAEHVPFAVQGPLSCPALSNQKAGKTPSGGADVLPGVTDDGAGGGRWRKEEGVAERAPRKREPGPRGRPGEGMLTWAPAHHHGHATAQAVVLPRLGRDPLCGPGQVATPLCASVFSSMKWRKNLGLSDSL